MDCVFGFHQSSSKGGRRFVCHFYVVASEVFGKCFGDAVDVGEGCPSRFAVLVRPLVIRRCISSVRGLEGFCIVLTTSYIYPRFVCCVSEFITST